MSTSLGRPTRSDGAARRPPHGRSSRIGRIRHGLHDGRAVGAPVAGSADTASDRLGGRSRLGEVPATLTVEVLEGRGIWLALHGALVDGDADVVSERLDRLGALGFSVVVLDLSDVSALDEPGARTIGAFVDSVRRGEGRVIAVDPAGRWGSAVDHVGAGLCVRRDAPSDASWLHGG